MAPSLAEAGNKGTLPVSKTLRFSPFDEYTTTAETSERIVLLVPFVYVYIYADHFFFFTPQWGTADGEIKNPPGGNRGLSKVPSF